jgi:hypothetical protein
MSHTVATEAGDTLGRLPHAVGVAIGQQQVGARLGQGQGHRAAHTAGGTGDDGHAAGEIKHALHGVLRKLPLP